MTTAVERPQGGRLVDQFEYGLDDTAQLAANGLGRVLEPAEVAATVGHVCSVAGAALHGSVVAVDGGFGG